VGQQSLRLGQPEGHVHGAVQLDGGGQLGVSLLSLASHGVQGAEATVAVGLEGTHAERLGESKGLPVVGFGLFGSGGIGVGMDSAKLVQRACLVPAFLELPSQIERLVCVLPGLLTASRQATDLAELCDPVRMI
jgi:hypothetical protein